jgi:hypothetical protein
MSDLYKYPDPDKIEINETDLKLRFAKYRDVVRNNRSALDLFIIIPAWLPVIFSNFNNLLGLSGTGIKYAYAAFLSIATVWWVVLVVRGFKNKGGLDPEEQVEMIKNDCISGNIKGEAVGNNGNFDLYMPESKINPKELLVERVRMTDRGSRDKWRKA